MIVVNVGEEICAPPFCHGYRRRDRYTHVREFRNIIRSEKNNFCLRILFENLGDHIACIIIIQCRNKFAFKGMSQLDIVRELWQQIGIALAIRERIQEIGEWI